MATLWGRAWVEIRSGAVPGWREGLGLCLGGERVWGMQERPQASQTGLGPPTLGGRYTCMLSEGGEKPGGPENLALPNNS